MRIVLKMFDFDKHQLITFDKKRGKQIWNYAHNESLSLSIPPGSTESLNLINRVRKIYKI